MTLVEHQLVKAILYYVHIVQRPIVRSNCVLSRAFHGDLAPPLPI